MNRWDDRRVHVFLQASWVPNTKAAEAIGLGQPINGVPSPLKQSQCMVVILSMAPSNV